MATSRIEVKAPTWDAEIAPFEILEPLAVRVDATHK